MADETTPARSRFRLKTILIIAGASLAGIGATMAATALVVVKVDRVHKAWCDRVHLLCGKTVATAVVAKPTPPEGCPDFLLKGQLVPRGREEQTAEIRAAMRGKVRLTAKDREVDAGLSDVICFDNRFLASFTEMRRGVTYQCMGVIEGATFSGVCDRSRPGRVDIAGEFFDDANLRGEIEDRSKRALVTDAAEDAAQKAMDQVSAEVKKAQKASKGKKKEEDRGSAGEAKKDGEAANDATDVGSQDDKKVDASPQEGHDPG